VSNLVLYAIPVFVVSVVIEALLARQHRELKGYELRDTTASLTLGLANIVGNALVKLIPIPLFAVLYEHRIADIGRAWWGWIVLLFAEDLCYYWFHRCASRS
jgi:sterol desaturase/sphingolipid hydroxylase (fatty acid hydroxylase superfamily)